MEQETRSFWMQNRVIIALALSMLALAEIIDLTIVAVALPNIMGSLSANIDEISLTITSYIVAAAVFIPLTGFVTGKFGVKRVALVSALLFGISSVLCGLATSVEEMVIFRLMQGIGGAFLPSLVQGYVVNNFEGNDRVKMMGIFSSCVVLGPIIGPMLGGAIAENMNWRWIFYVNVPICIVAFILIQVLMKSQEIKPMKADYTSFFFMALGFGCLEYFLDEGNSKSWFESDMLVMVLVSAIIFIGFFIWRGLLGKSVVNFKLFQQRNFMIACAALLVFMIMMGGILNFFPTLLQQGYGFPVDTAGYITAPRGIGASLAAPVFMRLGKKIDQRILMGVGTLFVVAAAYSLSSFSIMQSHTLIILTSFIQGIGFMGFFVNVMQLIYTNLPPELNSEAAGIFNFFRNIGSSIGTAIASTVISAQQQVSWHDLSSHVSKHSANFQHWAFGMSLQKSIGLATYQVQSQSFFIANLDVYHYAMIGAIFLLIFPFFLDKPGKVNAELILD